MYKSLISIIKKHIDLLFIALGLSLALSLSLYYLGNKSLFLDEVGSFTITQNWTHMQSIFRNSEGNMWFYYILLYFWTRLGTSEIILRSLSAIFAIATIIPLFYLTKHIFGNRTARISMILFPINIFFVKNAQFARGYSLLILLTTISSYLFLLYVHTSKKRYLLLYIILSVLSVYTHLFALFVIASQLFSLMFLQNKKSWKYFAVAYALILVLIIPIFISPSIHSQQINWIMKPTLIYFVGIYAILSGDFLPTTLISSLLILWYLYSIWNHGKFKSIINDYNFKFVVISFLLPCIASFIFSLTVKPILVLEYLVICLVPFILLLSAAFDTIYGTRLFKIILVLFILFSIIRLHGWYSEDQRFAVAIPNNTENWKTAAQLVSNYAKNNDAYLVLPTYSLSCFNYYYNQENLNTKVTELKLIINNSSIEVISNNHISPLSTIFQKYKRIWYMQDVVAGVGYNKMESDINKLLNKKYTLMSGVKFFRLTVYLYELKKNK